MNYIIFDLIIAAVLLSFLWRGWRKGFVLTLCSLIAVFVALAGAFILSNLLAEPAARLIEPVISSSIHDAVTSYWQRAPEAGASSQSAADWLAQLPLNQLLEPLKESGAMRGLANAFQEAVDAGVAEAASHAAQSLAHFMAVQIARSVVFMISFALVLFAWDVFSRTLNLVSRIPVLGAANRWAGGAVGLVEGSLVVFIAVWLLKDSFIPAEAVDGSFLLRFFAHVNPMSFFL